MDKAEGFHAQELAPSEWSEAEQTWRQAQTAIAEGRSAKAGLRKAKAQFNKSTAVAEANGKVMAKEISEMQTEINQRYLRIKAALKEGKPNLKVQKELDPILMEIALNASSIEDLNMHLDYMKAKAIAQDTLKKVEDAEHIAAGSRPVK